MRVFLSTMVLVGVAYAGYLALPGGVSAQAPLVVRPGETVLLRFTPSNSSTLCKVLEIRADFVQCESIESPRLGEKSAERWYNLHMVLVIEKPAKQE